MGFVVIFISLALGVIAVFSETSTEADNRGIKRVLPAGWLVLGLLCLAGLFQAFVETGNIKDIEHLKNKLGKNESLLEEQSFIATGSLLTAYSLKNKPVLNFCRLTNSNEQSEWDIASKFPPIQLDSTGSILEIEPSESSRSFFAMGSSIPTRHPFLPVEQEKSKPVPALNITYGFEPVPQEANHSFILTQYSALDTLLFDFSPGAKVGSLTIESRKDFTESDISAIRSLCDPRVVETRLVAYMNRRGSNLHLISLEIPITLTVEKKGTRKYTLTIISGFPKVINRRFSPI